MAENADGSIVIDCKLTVDEAEKSLASLRQKAIKLQTEITVKKGTQKYLQQEIAQTDAQLEKLSAKMSTATRGTISEADLAEFTRLQENAKELTAAYDRTGRSIETLQENLEGVKYAYGEVAQAQQQQTADSGIDESATEESVNRLHGIVQRIANYFREAWNESRMINDQGIIDVQNKLGELQQYLDTLGQQGQTFGFRDYDQTYAQIQQLEAELKNYQSGLSQTSEQSNFFTSVLKRIGSAASSAAKSLAQVAKRGITSGLKTLTSHATKAASSMLHLGNNSNKTHSGFSKGLKTMLKYGLGIRSVYMLFRKLRSALVDGYENLAQYDEQVNSSISAVKSSLTQLKNTFATAFAPLLNVVAPILTNFINLLSKAVNTLGLFFAALTGQSTYTKATEVQEDYAASLDSTADSASSAAEAVQNLSGLDEINTWNSGSSSGSGGGSSGTSVNDMFETVSVPAITFDSWGEAFDSFLDYMLTTGVPALETGLAKVSETVNTFAANLEEMFTFPGVLEKVALLGEEIAQALNDFVNDIDWATIGTALGAGLNLALQFLVSFITTFDWTNLGARLAEMVNNAVAEIDWKNVGTLIWAQFGIALETFFGFFNNLDMKELASAASDIVIGILEAISETIQTIDWYQVGYQIVTFICNVDWQGLGDTLWTTVGDALAGAIDLLLGALAGLGQSILDGIKEEIQGYIDEGPFDSVGMNILYGILNGIYETLMKPIEWVNDYILTPFIDGIKRIFGINSPATNEKLLECAGYIGEGILNGIGDKFTNAANWVKENIFQPITNAFSNLGDLVVSVGATIKDKASTLWSKWKSAWGTAASKGVEIANSLKEKAKSLWNSFKSDWNNGDRTAAVTNLLKNTASSLWSGFKSAWSTVSSAGVTIANTLKDTASNLWSSFTSSWTSSDKEVSITNTLKNSASSLWESVKSSWNKTTTTLSATVTPTVSKKLTLSNLVDKNSTLAIKVSANGSTITGAKMLVAARGGIVNFATLFGGRLMAGEDGTEAIVPLERHTEWADIVATQMAGKLAQLSGGSDLSGLFSGLRNALTAVFKTPFTQIGAALDQIGNAPSLSAYRSISLPAIPALASGAAIPPNREFLSVLGDQSTGYNLEGPESMFRQIVREELAKASNGGNTYNVTATARGKTIFEMVIEEGKAQQTRTGRNPFDLARG